MPLLQMDVTKTVIIKWSTFLILLIPGVWVLHINHRIVAVVLSSILTPTRVSSDVTPYVQGSVPQMLPHPSLDAHSKSRLSPVLLIDQLCRVPITPFLDPIVC